METFARVFGSCDWAVMFILGRTAKTFARLKFHVGRDLSATMFHNHGQHGFPSDQLSHNARVGYWNAAIFKLLDCSRRNGGITCSWSSARRRDNPSSPAIVIRPSFEPRSRTAT